ncbi:MAG: hypothetical protein FJ267_16415, partial [Planctomycetes bacterium]|nr:hypothetical protein [Planctomycetota bacterium]
MSIVNVFAVDITPGGYPTGTTYVPNRLDTVLVSVDDSTMDASFIAANILATTQQRAGAHSTIRQLHLCSHGNSGTLLMGKGIDVSNVSGFGILAGHFSPVGPLSASILIHGCAVASSTTIDDGCFETNSTGRRIPRSV